MAPRILIFQKSHWFFRCVLLAALVVIALLATTDRSIPMVESVWDKANHFIAFAVLACLADLGYPDRSRLEKLGLLLCYGVLIEVVQWGLPWRDFSLLDILADLVGLLAWSGLCRLWLLCLPLFAADRRSDF